MSIKNQCTIEDLLAALYGVLVGASVGKPVVHEGIQNEHQI